MPATSASRSDIEAAIKAAHPGIPKETISKVVEATFISIAKKVGAGETVGIHQFGVFTPTVRAARTGRNPQTGARMTIPAKRTVKFKVAAKFTAQLNSSN